MSKTVVGLFDDYQDAQNVVRDLTTAGFRRESISIAANKTASGYTGDGSDFGAASSDTGHAVGKDAGVGAGVGGDVGLLVGLSLLTIPGIGPVLAAGPIAAALGIGAAATSTVVGAGIGAVAGGLIGGLTHIGVPKEHAEYYAEGVRRGGTLVTVDAPDNQAQQAVDIMNGNGAVDIDTRGAAYRSSGYTGYTETAAPYAMEDITRERGTYRTANAGSTANTGTVNTGATAKTGTMNTSVNTQGETVIPIVEEEIAVGKRQVQSGGARIHTYVTEKPVEASVTLHEERVTVDRRPVDRAVTDADMAFGEKSFEVTETSEEAVVGKTARVVEEVVVGKTATERTETVRDTVRRTDVEVEDLTDTSRTTGTDRR